MNAASPPISAPDIPIAKVFRLWFTGCVVLFVAILGAFGISLTPIVLLAAVGTFVWLAFRYPIRGLGLFLAIMPAFTLVFLVTKFFGPPYIGLLEGADRVVLLLLVFALCWKSRIKFTTPDWLLVGCFAMAALHLLLSGSLLPLLADFNFTIAYAAGRFTSLTTEQEQGWAHRAVWIVAVLAIVGMIEVFVIGEAPRTLLYLAVARGGTQGGMLDNAFHGAGYAGLRESSTMFGPLQFAPLCMLGLVVWWVYSRKPVPGVMIAAGLICTVTRSAWLGTAIAISVLAVIMGKTKWLVRFGGLMLALFIAAIPILGLTDYLRSSKSGDDPSAQGHFESVVDGISFTAHHPFGVGPGNAGKFAVQDESNAFAVENTFLTFAAEYGVITTIVFCAFLATTVRVLWRRKERVAYAAIGSLLGFSVVMMFAALHDVFPLACWLWFPVGLAIRSASEENRQAARFARVNKGS